MRSADSAASRMVQLNPGPVVVAGVRARAGAGSHALLIAGRALGVHDRQDLSAAGSGTGTISVPY
jgi:hypothetical protein